MGCRLDHYPHDFYEAQFIGYIRERLPSYERFWGEFVRPLRIQGGTRILGAPEQERMAEAHYSVFWHLVNAWRLRQELEQPSDADSLLAARPAVDALFFRMGAAADMVEEFPYRWAVIELRLASGNREATPVCARMCEGQVVDKARVYFRKDYAGDLMELKKTGRPVKIDLHDRRDLYRAFLESAGAPVVAAHRRLQTQADRARQYRNDIVHGAALASRLESGPVLMIPKLGAARKRSSWSDLRRKAEDGESVFAPAVEVVDELLQGLEETINCLLEAVIPHCRELTANATYQQWLEDARRRFAAAHRQAEGDCPERRAPKSLSGTSVGAHQDDDTSIVLSTDSGEV